MGITISTLDCTEEIKDKLSDKLGSMIIYDESESKDYTLFKIDFDKSKQYSTLENLAGVIADIVVEHLEKKFINSIIKHKYGYFSSDERNKIQEMTLDHLNKSVITDSKLGKILRREEIIKQILNYLNNSQDLNIEGFVRFRLKDYINQLKLAVEKSVDDFIIEKEYNEFIDLLKYFVELQEPRIPLVNVVQREDSSFQILDEQGNIIDSEYLEGYLAEMFGEEIDYEDLLVSALINVAPLKIILHFREEEAVETVKKIFGDRVEVCSGCRLCKI